jgi:hypothetical protein
MILMNFGARGMSGTEIPRILIECVWCCKEFVCKEGGEFYFENICGECWLNKQQWYKCPDCGCVVMSSPCFICENGWRPK